MATFGFRYLSGPYEVHQYGEASGQSFVAGDLVYLVNGLATVVADDETIAGVALTKATTATTGKIDVLIISPDQEFVAQANTTTALTQIGTAYALTITSGSMDVNNGSTTTPAFTITNLDPRDGAASTGAKRVIGRFLETSCQLHGLGV